MLSAAAADRMPAAPGIRANAVRILAYPSEGAAHGTGIQTEHLAEDDETKWRIAVSRPDPLLRLRARPPHAVLIAPDAIFQHGEHQGSDPRLITRLLISPCLWHGLQVGRLACALDG